jgi:pSer/pThr/pTyr-binding forkhead associated (FHA) protein
MPFIQKDTTPSVTLVGNHAPVEPEKAPEETASVYAFLCYEKDGVETARFAITKKDVVVGRMDPKRGITPDIDLTVADVKMTVSRQHARIRYEETFFYIEDLKSRNKTRLGELTLVPLKPELLQHGDILHFGSVRLVFKIPGMRDKPVFKEDKG